MHYLLMGFAPGIYWLWYFYKRDKLNPEPKRLVIGAYLAGIFVAFFVVLAQLPISASPRVSAVVFAPLFEESGKLLMTILIIYQGYLFGLFIRTIYPDHLSWEGLCSFT